MGSIRRRDHGFMTLLSRNAQFYFGRRHRKDTSIDISSNMSRGVSTRVAVKLVKYYQDLHAFWRRSWWHLNIGLERRRRSISFRRRDRISFHFFDYPARIATGYIKEKNSFHPDRLQLETAPWRKNKKKELVNNKSDSRCSYETPESKSRGGQDSPYCCCCCCSIIIIE